LGENLEVGYGVGTIWEERVKVVGVAVGDPDGPMVAGSAGSSRNDAGLDGFINKEAVSAESIGGRRGQRIHGKGCG